MSIKIFRSKNLAMTALFVFCLFLVSTTYAPASPAAQDVQTTYQEAIDLYNQGNFSGAIQQFNKVMTMTQDATILTDTYFYLSICFLYEGDTATAKEYVKMMLRNDPSREVSSAYPAEYRAIFKDAQKELKKESKQQPVEQPVVEDVPTYYTEPAVQKEKKGKGMLLIVGGVVLAGGAAAVLLLLGEKFGTIDVSSTPAGAAIFLGGSDTGQVTPATIEEVEPGSYEVGVRLDGYVNFSQTVTVEKKQAATVSANLTAHTIAVTNPGAGDVWVKGQNYNINWTVGGSGQVNVMLQPQGNTENPVSPSLRLMANRSHAIQNRMAGADGIQKDADSKLSFGSKEYRTKDLNPDLNLSRPDQSNPGMQALPQLRLRSPGEVRPMDIANMLIELLRAGAVVQTIATSTPNDGTHPWTAPNGVPNAGNFVVRVASAITNAVFGLSPQFWITAVGSIQCNSNPTGADIFLDGTDTGFNTNKKLNNIPVGNHAVRYEKDRYKNYTQNVNVAQGATSNVNKTLVPGNFLETFATSALYWTKRFGPGNWTVSSGTYRVSGGWSWQINEYNIGGTGKFSGTTYQADVDFASGSDGKARGIKFGGTGNLRTGYVFQIAQAGGKVYYEVFYEGNYAGSWVWLRFWTNTGINASTWHTVKVEINGSNVKFYVDNVLVWNTNLGSMPAQWEIGLMAHTDGGQTMQFDNAQVSGVAAPAPTAAPGQVEFAQPLENVPAGMVPTHISGVKLPKKE